MATFKKSPPRKKKVISVVFLLSIKFSPRSHRLLIIFLISVKKMKVQMQMLQPRPVSTMCLLKEEPFANALNTWD